MLILLDLIWLVSAFASYSSTDAAPLFRQSVQLIHVAIEDMIRMMYQETKSSIKYW